MATIDDLMDRLIRVESRLVQLMLHMGATPKGVLPDKDDPAYWGGKRLNREAEVDGKKELNSLLRREP